MSDESSQTELLAARLAGVTEAQAREINQFLDNRKAEAISVGDLLKLGYQYFIPNYQRGYRWTSLEVKTLLRDIQEAREDKKHCLQPLVLKKREGEKGYTVIDGQQRLTTISIILAWCNQKEQTQYSHPDITYETRTRSKEFLDKIPSIFERYVKKDNDSPGPNPAGAGSDENEDNDLRPGANVDFWNMYQAYVCCEEYAKGKENIVSIIKENLLNHCSFILYIAGEGENEHEIFKRLNSGKIALTNAELTKALLLHDRPYKEQLEMALKWDEMMHFFENDDFWYFICPNPEDEKYKQTRLDFLIELVTGTESGTEGDRYASFRTLYEQTRQNGQNDEQGKQGSLKEAWNNMIKYYHIVRYWYEDTPQRNKKTLSFYHLVGFIIHDKIKEVKKLLTEFANGAKNFFRENCLTLIRNELSIGSEDELKTKISELSYGKDNGGISSLLLLMNVATLEFNAGENSRYPFASHVREKWSLEHIHARQEEACIERLVQYKKLLGLDLEGANGLQEGHIEDKQKLNDEYNRILDFFEEKYKGGVFNYETSFGNLALLPKNFNSHLNNKGYQEKRELIAKACVQTDENAILPICTRYAFFKFYSPGDDSNIVWDGKNASDYTEKAIDLISKYLNLK